MTIPITLSDNQRHVLEHAIEHTAGAIQWFPEHVKGGARQKVLESLVKRGLASQQNEAWAVTPAAYSALALTLPEASCAPKPRAGSKQAIVISLLERPEGATMAQMGAATGWQAHSVRGLLAGTIEKKFKHNVVSEKILGQARVYRIAADKAALKAPS